MYPYNIDNKLRLSDYYTNGNNVKISDLKLSTNNFNVCFKH